MSLPSHLPKYTSIKHRHFESDYGTFAIHQPCQAICHHWATASTWILAEIARELVEIHPIKCKPSLTPPKIQIDQTLSFWKCLLRLCHPPTMPNNPSPPGYCFYSIFCGNHSRTCSDTSNQARAFHHPPKIQINQTSPFRKRLRHLCHPPKASNNRHHWTTGSTSILAEIAWKLMEIYPIKCKPSHTPPNIHINQTLPFRKWLQHRWYPPTTQNNPSPLGYCLHFNSWMNCIRTRGYSSNQVQAFPHISQNTHQSNISISEVIAALMISTDNNKQSLTTRLLLSH